MFAGTALSVRLFVCAGLSLFIICWPYLSVVVCVFYAYNLTLPLLKHACGEQWLAAMLAAKRSAGVVPKVNLGEHTSCKLKWIRLSLTLQNRSRCHHKSKTDLSVAPCVYQNFNKKNLYLINLNEKSRVESKCFKSRFSFPEVVLRSISSTTPHLVDISSYNTLNNSLCIT